MKIFLATMGFLSLAIGIIGIFLPLLPTAPFVILAAWCFAKSSDRFHQWLLNHSLTGPMILRWRQSRAVPPRAKLLAVGMMSVSLVMMWALIHNPFVLAGITFFLMASAIFILSLPS